MRIYLLLTTLAIVSTSFSQKESFGNHVNIELIQTFGNIMASDSERNPARIFNVSEPISKISISVLNNAGYYVEPFVFLGIKEAEFTAKNTFSGTVGMISESANIRSFYTHTGITIGTTKSLGAGLLLMKRISKYFEIGGGLQINYRESKYFDLSIAEIQQKTAGTYTTIKTINDYPAFAGRIENVVLSIPMQLRFYVPIGKHFFTGTTSLQLSKSAWLQCGLGFSF